MFLSKVYFFPSPELHNAYVWHQRLWRLFPDIPSGKRAPFLYSWMQAGNPAKGGELLLLSCLEPLGRADGVQILSTKPFTPVLHAGQQLLFRLVANPTRLITDTHSRPSKRNRGKCRVPLIKEEEQKNWLMRKLKHVAEMGAVAIHANPLVRFRKPGSYAGKVVPVTYEGVLRVSNAQALADLIGRGIGPAKAFGCGLMLVRRV